MSDEYQVSPGDDGNESTPMADRHWVRTLVAVAGVVGAAAAVVSAAIAATGGLAGTPSEEQKPPEVNGSPSPSASHEIPSEATTASGQASTVRCWSAAGEMVRCSAPHNIEIVDIDPTECNQRSLVAYMGGNPDLDVTWVSARAQSSDDEELCIAVAQREWSMPLDSALVAPDADVLRWCIDERLTSQSVGCDVEHTAELMGPAAPELELETCLEVAAQYTDVATGRLDERLQVQVRPTSDDRQVCAIAVTGGDRLDGSLRLIASSAIPLAAG